MRKSIGWVTSVVIAVALAGSASAGVADPVPLIGGTLKAKHVFSIPGVTATTTVGTIIACTSLEKTRDQTIAVEVFAEDPATVLNDITLGGVTNGVPGVLSPGETAMIEIATIDGNVFFTARDAWVTTAVSHGSARVVSTSSRLMCTAALVDRVSDPPVFGFALQVIAKTKQKGD